MLGKALQTEGAGNSRRVGAPVEMKLGNPPLSRAFKSLKTQSRAFVYFTTATHVLLIFFFKINKLLPAGLLCTDALYCQAIFLVYLYQIFKLVMASSVEM